MFKINFTEAEIKKLADAAYVLSAIAEFCEDTGDTKLAEAATDTERAIVAVMAEIGADINPAFNPNKHYNEILKDAHELLAKIDFFVPENTAESKLADFHNYFVQEAMADLGDFRWFFDGVNFNEDYLFNHIFKRIDDLSNDIDACEIQLEVCRTLRAERLHNGLDVSDIEYEAGLLIFEIRTFTDALNRIKATIAG